MQTVNVLGSEYKIIKKKYDDEPYFKKFSCDGYCDQQDREIVVCDMSTYHGCDSITEHAKEVKEKEILRHEIVHAFLNESGLTWSANSFSESWAKNEEMVDWIAIQFPKILKAYQEVGAL